MMPDDWSVVISVLAIVISLVSVWFSVLGTLDARRVIKKYEAGVRDEASDRG